MKYIATVNEKQFVIDIDREGQVSVDGKVINANMQHIFGNTMYSFVIEGKSHDIRMQEEDEQFEVLLGGEIFEVSVQDERTQRLAGLKGLAGAVGEWIVKAPMPGVIIDVPVKLGQEIDQGDVVLILESMKMQNEFKAIRSGMVKRIQVAPGDVVEQNTVMLVIA